MGGIFLCNLRVANRRSLLRPRGLQQYGDKLSRVDNKRECWARLAFVIRKWCVIVYWYAPIQSYPFWHRRPVLGGVLLGICVVCPQIGTAVPNGL